MLLYKCKGFWRIWKYVKIIYKKSFDHTVKKLKKHEKEKANLEKILEIIRNCISFDELKKDPLANMYGFEQLKYRYNEFYSFNLEKNGGVFRLIVKPCLDTICLYLIYICNKHYKDFDMERVIYYEEK